MPFCAAVVREGELALRVGELDDEDVELVELTLDDDDARDSGS